MAATLVLTAPVDAAVLCAKKRGALAIRDACKPKETQVDVASLGLVGPPGPQGPVGPEGPPGMPTVGTPQRQQFESPGGFLTDSSFTTGSTLTDAVFFRFAATGPAVCTLIDGGGLITNLIVDATAHEAIAFETPIPISGTLAAGCNGSTPAQVLLVGTLPAP